KAVGGRGSPARRTRTHGRGAVRAPRPWTGRLTEEAQQDRRGLVGDRERLDAQLLLGLQSLQASAFLRQVGVDEVAHAGVDGVLQLRDEGVVRLKRLSTRT